MKTETKKTEIAETKPEATTKSAMVRKPAPTPNIPGMPDRITIAIKAAKSYTLRPEVRRKLAKCKSRIELRRELRSIYALAIKLYS